MKVNRVTYNYKDATGTQEFTYGNMGEVIENIHTYVVPYNSEPI
ncbi:MAG: hypothetical protein H6Q16_2128, partial [Bacteroidetes bacterium]|nr:hypothetical protein [Bacteroidota bacterium]